MSCTCYLVSYLWHASQVSSAVLSSIYTLSYFTIFTHVCTIQPSAYLAKNLKFKFMYQPSYWWSGYHIYNIIFVMWCDCKLRYWRELKYLGSYCPTVATHYCAGFLPLGWMFSRANPTVLLCLTWWTMYLGGQPPLLFAMMTYTPKGLKNTYRRSNHFKMFNPIVPRSTKLPIGHYYLELLPRYAKGTARSHEELYNLVPLGKVVVTRAFRTLAYITPHEWRTLDPCCHLNSHVLRRVVLW